MPLPFQKSLYHKLPHQQNMTHSHETPLILSPSGTPPPTNDNTQEDSLINRRRSASFKHKKSLSGSMDTQLDGAIHGSIPWKGKVQVGPYRRSSVDTTPPVGWPGQTHFSANRGAKTPADIQSLMLADSVLRSSNSTEIKPELFANSPNNEHFGRILPKDYTLTERVHFTSDLRDGNHLKRSFRSSSAKQHHHSIMVTSNYNPELSASAKHFGDLEPLGPINGLKLQSSLHNQRELPHIDILPNNIKVLSWLPL